MTEALADPPGRTRTFGSGRIVDQRELWIRATQYVKYGTTLIDYIYARLENDWQFNCWLWTKRVDKWGYASVKIDGKSWYIHRLLYELYRGCAEGLDLDHRCRMPACANPWHLEPVSTTTNAARALGYGAQDYPYLQARLAKEGKRCEHGHNPPSRCPACRKKRKAMIKRRSAAGAETRRRQREEARAAKEALNGGTEPGTPF